jgi:hypothetical protein
LKPFQLVFGLFLPLVFELLASRPTSLTARFLQLQDFAYTIHRRIRINTT